MVQYQIGDIGGTDEQRGVPYLQKTVRYGMYFYYIHERELDSLQLVVTLQ